MVCALKFPINLVCDPCRSGLEIAMCSEQIYGSDVDFISWDFGMTDGKEYFKLLMYAYRAVLAPGHPAFLFFNGGSKYGDRTNILMDLETRMGMSVFDSPQDSLQPITGAIPNMFGKNDDEIAKMPEYVRYLKCQDTVEKGDPFCSAMKYSNYTCSPRKKQTGWHPG